MLRLVLDCHYHLDLYANTFGYCSHAHGVPGMGANLTVWLAQKVGCSGGDLGMSRRDTLETLYADRLGGPVCNVEIAGGRMAS